MQKMKFSSYKTTEVNSRLLSYSSHKTNMDVDQITLQMKSLQEMSKKLESQLSSMRGLDIETPDDDDEEEIFDADIDDDDEIIEVGGTAVLPLPIQANLSPKKEPVEAAVEDDLDIESRELLDNSDPVIDESICEQDIYVGHQMEEQSMVNIKAEPEEVKDEKVDIGDLTMPASWTVKYSKGKFDGKFLYTSPDGRYFYSVQQSIEYMLERDAPKELVEIMKTNLKYEGWKEVDYLPPAWMLKYYKATNAYIYLSPDCRLFKSAKAVTDFMKKNNYNPKIIEDVKREMAESKKFNSKLKFKWVTGENLPKGWKVRKQKGSGRKNPTDVEFILSDDGIQFKTRFEALHYLISNKYSEQKIKELRQKLLASSEKWKESKLLPEGWIYKFKGLDSSTTAITYFSREGQIYHSMKNVMDFMGSSNVYTEKDISNCKEFLKSVVQYAARKYEWDQDKSVPEGWSVRKASDDGEKESGQILSPEGLAFRYDFKNYLIVIS